jgi:hypothetical protein
MQNIPFSVALLINNKNYSKIVYRFNYAVRLQLDTALVGARWAAIRDSLYLYFITVYTCTSLLGRGPGFPTWSVSLICSFFCNFLTSCFTSAWRLGQLVQTSDCSI